jgi:ABC-type branched-subunit amino acid transport system substrate-binding protein
MPDPKVQAFVKAFRARYPGQAFTYIAPITYDIVYIIKTALEAAGAVDREKFLDAVRKIDMIGAYGGRRIRFDNTGQAIGMSQFIVRWQDGRREVVYRSANEIPEKRK